MSFFLLQINSKRNASFELMRLLCMMMIVFYHLLIRVDVNLLSEHVELRALTLPLHIAVVCFVLISGFFGIKESSKKILPFYIQVLFYNVLIYVVCAYVSSSFSARNFFLSFLPITDNKDLWFVRTYFMFLLIVPIINKFIKTTTRKEHGKLCLILMFISMYLGIRGNDVSISDGKNLVNFSMIYCIGNWLKEKNIKISGRNILLAYLFLNIILCSAYISSPNCVSAKIITYSFGYNSPLLLLNAVLFFMIFSKIKIHSHFILWIANSVFSIYLIHSNSNVQMILWPKLNDLCKDHSILPSYFFVTLLIIVVCITIDKCLQPIYMYITTICENIVVKLEKS